uniref:Photosynthetic NDH subunit of subcomplex B 4, chloroplastic n=1 Tax=Ananas comosus var. bracteatus TaxID=296719 RepID=A0A6V7P7N6_ANACO|nr:unnamed protein product [Ananas comosus var. bracteatus]
MVGLDRSGGIDKDTEFVWKSSEKFKNVAETLVDWREKGRGSSSWKLNAFPDWPLMAIMIEHVAGQRDYVVHKSVWHLSDAAMKNVCEHFVHYVHMLGMLLLWIHESEHSPNQSHENLSCFMFSAITTKAMKQDPFYDGEEYRKDGGDGTVHWVYEKQEDIEEAARAELWREELIEEIEQKVGGLRELEEAGKEEEYVK